ncbi:hypothetical protein [Neisseria weaveri]|uniref:hypothetical protein n=1 Tax=Neisseria weaveri TaxID=28091 RepID=UPI0019028699|nr:hypothetical protein [Neisseria weaveri]
MKKSLIALSLAALANTFPHPFSFEPASVSRIRQHPSLKRGKSGVAAARRAAKQRKARK